MKSSKLTLQSYCVYTLVGSSLIFALFIFTSLFFNMFVGFYQYPDARIPAGTINYVFTPTDDLLVIVSNFYRRVHVFKHDIYVKGWYTDSDHRFQCGIDEQNRLHFTDPSDVDNYYIYDLSGNLLNSMTMDEVERLRYLRTHTLQSNSNLSTKYKHIWYPIRGLQNRETGKILGLGLFPYQLFDFFMWTKLYLTFFPALLLLTLFICPSSAIRYFRIVKRLFEP